MEENPLTEEQIKRINGIAKLPETDQKKEWPKFLKTLNKEQIEFLKEQQQKQGGECLFCSIIEGKIPCKKIYEDNDMLAFLDINPVNKGHTLVIPRRHYITLLDTPDELLFKLIIVTKKLASILMKSLNAVGFNVNINNYSDAGQVVPHLHIHIVPRFSGDGHKLWDGRKYESEEEFNSVLESIKKNIKGVEPKKEIANSEIKKVKIEDYEEEPRIP